MDKKDFFIKVLKGLNIPNNGNNLAFLLKWSNYEKRPLGVVHGFNPLNTTKKVLGSINMKGSINAGYPVQDYPTEAAGIQATILTLKNGYYNNILAGLKSGKNVTSLYNTPKIASDLKKWGTHSFAKNFIDYNGKPPIKTAKTPPVLIYILLIGLVSYFCYSYYVKGNG
jgi:hypothetical protein